MAYPRHWIIVALLGIAPTAQSADIGANALRDASSLTRCMKALDTECTLKWMYTRNLEAQGFEKHELRAQLAASFENLRYVQAKTEQLDLGVPLPPFSGDGLKYIFIPYQETMTIQGQTYHQTAYYIGVSEDSGGSWKFIDGIGFSEKNIREVIPSYSGGALPPRSTEPAASP